MIGTNAQRSSSSSSSLAFVFLQLPMFSSTHTTATRPRNCSMSQHRVTDSDENARWSLGIGEARRETGHERVTQEHPGYRNHDLSENNVV
eukprot:2550109-Rhodomonas_salina.2